ncbi:50S ribosomal protein L2 [Candidatus Woesearchaeota archaeon]|nr:50S ribosomal protein L2 [Candidatus Woesearchaeota archaeon]
MGKNLIQQRRGKGSGRFRTRSFASAGSVSVKQKKSYQILDLIRSTGHSAPLARIKYDDESMGLIIAAEGVYVGKEYVMGEEAPVAYGNVLPLKSIPEGTPIFNIESKPGDGGKFIRSSGGSAKLVSRSEKSITVKLPSKKNKLFHPECRAIIGVVSGGGRPEKPLLKAGTKHHIMKARNKYYPSVSGSAMNAVAHPFGNKRSLRKSKAKPTSKNAPPGRKVGAIGARRTGRRK